jgi:hypothetical protein
LEVLGTRAVKYEQVVLSILMADDRLGDSDVPLTVMRRTSVATELKPNLMLLATRISQAQFVIAFAMMS